MMGVSVIHLGAPFDRRFDPDRRGRQHRSLFVSQLDTDVLLEPTGSVSVFGACFHPDGASAFARWPQHETAGRILPLDDVWGGAAEARRHHSQCIRGCLPHRRRGELPARADARAPDRPLRHAIELMLREPWRGVAAIAEEMGSSTRSLEGRFWTGLDARPRPSPGSPDSSGHWLSARHTRNGGGLALRGIRLLRPGTHWRWARVAVESGYYDQAHLISDFHQLSGMTPALHQDDLTEIETLFLRARR
jgi:AraC-like DNA-binding protein